MKRGEAVRCIDDYDLFEKNVNGEEGCFIKFSEINDKYLVWFPCNGEWAELKEGQFEMVNKPGYIPAKYKKFVKHVKTLEYTY
ncbi:MAG: hypothetical protein CMA72_09090 [Euryarchaeota archaeon]|nr:hypothetical protein [Euryarchaeota archaeon]|tara:strand:- start:123 stop:371 length:249 start_codon:yes stop_codon:yes gene_type:complete